MRGGDPAITVPGSWTVRQRRQGEGAGRGGDEGAAVPADRRSARCWRRLPRYGAGQSSWLACVAETPGEGDRGPTWRRGLTGPAEQVIVDVRWVLD